jgi:hypothetical protein
MGQIKGKILQDLYRQVITMIYTKSAGQPHERQANFPVDLCSEQPAAAG